MRWLLGLLWWLPIVALAGMEDKPAAALVGIWEGTLDVAGSKLRLIFEIKAAGEKLTATMDSLDQGAKGIPLSPPVWKDGTLTLELPAAKLTYSARLSADGQELRGTFKQSGLELPLTLKRVQAKTVLKRPQEPKPPLPYREEEVTFENPQAPGVTLAGTLTLPAGPGPFPAAILISGSGPQDRNEEIFGHKPFWVIADHLTRQGVAVLRYDDRGVAKSKGNFATATSKDFASDAEAAFAFLQARKEIDGKKIGFIGHSEGGLIAPMIAARKPDVAFLVLLAGPGLPGADILRRQVVLVAKAEGADDDATRLLTQVQDDLLRLAATETDAQAFRKKATAQMRERLEKLSPAELKRLLPPGVKPKSGDGEVTVDELVALAEPQLQGLLAPWMSFYLKHDPRTELRRVKCPVLAMNGELDLHVQAAENLAEIEKALKEAGNTDVTIKLWPKLNHLFQPTQTGKISEYVNIEQTIHPEVLELMAGWLKQRFKEE
jgi:pimeloyl-ACP methyl ester carboxylesterase